MKSIFLVFALVCSSAWAGRAEYYEDVSSSMPDMSPVYALFTSQSGASSTPIAVAELTGDNYPEIVLHIWEGQNTFGLVSTAPINNRLVVLSRDKSGKYRDIAADLVAPQSPTLQGATRQVDVGDLNGDGFADVAWSVSREDGRSTATVSQIASQTNVLISQGQAGRYRIESYGPSNWFHAVAVAPAVGELPGIVLPLGFNNGVIPTPIVWRNGQPAEEVANSLMTNAVQVQAGTTSHIGYLDDFSSQKRYFYADTSSTPGNWFANPSLLVRDGAGNWSVAAQYKNSLSSEARQINYVSWSKDTGTTYLYNCPLGQCLGTDGAYQAHVWHPYPGAKPQIVTINSAMVPTVDPAKVLLVEGETTYNAMFHKFYSYDGGTFSQVAGAISGEKVKVNALFEDVVDLDRDGLEDIIVYPQSVPWSSSYSPNDALPIFYKNRGDGTLILDTSIDYPQIPRGGALAAKFFDANADGVMDLFLHPYVASLQNVSSSKTFLLYLGRTGSRPSPISAPTYPAPNANLKVTITKGNGSITSSPEGIDCGSTCTYAFTKKMIIKLTATPAEGARFGGWSGACTGKKLTCSVRLTGNKSVKAKFK